MAEKTSENSSNQITHKSDKEIAQRLLDLIKLARDSRKPGTGRWASVEDLGHFESGNNKYGHVEKKYIPENSSPITEPDIQIESIEESVRQKIDAGIDVYISFEYVEKQLQEIVDGSRTELPDFDFEARAKYADSLHDDYEGRIMATSWHNNGYPLRTANGYEVLTSKHEAANTIARHMAEEVQVGEFGLKMRADDGIKNGWGRGAQKEAEKTPFVLCEPGFMSNKHDAEKLLDRDFVRDIAGAQIRGQIKYMLENGATLCNSPEVELAAAQLTEKQQSSIGEFKIAKVYTPAEQQKMLASSIERRSSPSSEPTQVSEASKGNYATLHTKSSLLPPPPPNTQMIFIPPPTELAEAIKPRLSLPIAGNNELAEFALSLAIVEKAVNSGDVLEVGDKGNKVEALQKVLNSEILAKISDNSEISSSKPLPVTGNFRTATAGRVRDLQGVLGFEGGSKDSQFGLDTLTKLKENLQAEMEPEAFSAIKAVSKKEAKTLEAAKKIIEESGAALTADGQVVPTKPTAQNNSANTQASLQA